MSKKIKNPNIEALKAAMLARVPTMLVGPPGIGKTAMMRELAEEIGYKLITVIGSTMDPTDVTGLPKAEQIAEKDGRPLYGTVYVAPVWQVRCLIEKKVVLFFDEFSNTPAATRAALLTFFQNREFQDGTPLPDEVIVVGAMNPPEEAADAYELDYPTTNRMMFLSWDSLAEEWYEGMLNGWGNEVIPPKELAWRRKIVSFMRDFPNRLHVLPNEHDSGDSSDAVFNINNHNPSEMAILNYAWPSRRSWHNVARILANCEDDVNVQDKIIQGTVGFAAATDFRGWLRKNSSLDIQEVMNDPHNIDWAAIGVDEANVLLRSVVELSAEGVDNYRKVGEVFIAIADADRYDIGAAHFYDFIKQVKSVKNATSDDKKELSTHIRTVIMPKYNMKKRGKEVKA